MNKITAIVTSVIVLVFAAFLLESASTYKINATVKTVNGVKCFVDSNGEAWSDDRAYDFDNNTMVEITMKDNGTDDTRLDDIVKKVEKVDVKP